MGQHTPGPWKWWTSNSWRRLSQDRPRAVEGGVLCPVVSRSDGHPDMIVSEPDMALIAAAPDLLAALKAVVSVADRATVEFDAARAAIARAEGSAS